MGSGPGKGRRAGDLRIRPGRLADLETLLAFEAQAFSVDRLSRRSFRRLLESPRAWLGVAERQGVFAGYALVLFHEDRAAARLYSIGVAAPMARQGIGRALLAAAEAAAARRGRTAMRLEVQVGNKPAIGIYEASGYRRAGRLARYYEDGSDAWRYEKALVP